MYWAGHGKRDGDGLFLVTKNTPAANLTGWNSLSASDLGSAVAKSPAEKVLILLDTCYSGAGAGEIVEQVRKVLATRPELPGRYPAYAVIASAHPLKKAQEAVFCKALTEVLNNPLAERPWTDHDQFIGSADLAEAVATKLDDYVGYEADGLGQRFIPNPRYKSALPAEDVETRRWRLEAAKDHFLPASQGIEVGELGWYFTGRTRLLKQLVTWLKNAQHGLVVVTGPAGSGKSAVMGRLATLSDPTYRMEAERIGALRGAEADALPPIGVIEAAVHLKGKTLLDSIGATADALDLKLTEDDRADPKALVETIGDLNRRFTLLFDALDEAKPGYPYVIAERLINPLAALRQVRVLVGTRRSPDGSTLSAHETRHARLRELFGADTLIFDLEDEPDALEDIAQYVRLRLQDSRHRNDRDGIERVAGAIAERASGIFLYARIVYRTLRDMERLDIELPTDTLDVFVNDLTQRFGDRQGMVNDLLAALAWGEGKGLTRQVWGPIASILSKTRARYRDEDVAWALKHAGWYVVEAGEGGQAVYRLVHQALVDYYRSGVDAKIANAGITEALGARLKGKDWLDADGYVCRHLASHAAAGRKLDKLILDPGYLAVAEPIRLVAAFANLADDKAREIADVYRRVAHELPMAEPLERMALIHLAACQDAPELAPDLEPPLLTAWRCRWARWLPSAPHRILGRHAGRVTAVALGEVDGEPVVVSGSWDNSVRLWDVHSGQPRGTPLKGHTSSVYAVALGEVDGEPVVVSGGGDATVRLWDARSGELCGVPLTGHTAFVTAVALGEVDGEPVVASGSGDSTVRLWDARGYGRRTSLSTPTGRRPVWVAPAFNWRSILARILFSMGPARGVPLRGHTNTVTAVALGEVDGEPVVVSGSFDQTVRLWDTRSGQPRSEPLTGHTDLVTAVALGEVDGAPLVVSGSDDQTLRLWDARSGQPRGKPLTGHTRGLTAVTLGEVDGAPVVVSGSYDDTVRLWDARSGQPRGEPLTGHTGYVIAVALGEVDGAPVVVSGSADETVRLWDARGWQSNSAPVLGHTKPMTAVASGEVDGESVVVTGSYDNTMRLWDARSGQPRGAPLLGHTKAVTAVALGEVDGAPVVVSGSDDNSLRLWDARSRQPRNAPLLGHTKAVTAVALGEVDGEPVVVSGSRDNTVRLWDARSGQPRGAPLLGHTKAVTAVALGEVDGAPVVVSGSDDNSLRLWDARSGQPRNAPLLGHTKAVTAVALGEVDSEPLVVSGSGDNTVRLWDARSGKARGTPLTGHKSWVSAVALCKVDGAPMVVSGSWDDTVRLWDPRSDNLLRTLVMRSPVRNLALENDSAIVVRAPFGFLVIDFASI